MTPEQRVSEATSATHLAYRAGITVAAAKALYAALATNPTVQDAVLAALVEGGRLVEEARCSCGGQGTGHRISDQHDTGSLVRLVEPEWREATP